MHEIIYPSKLLPPKIHPAPNPKIHLAPNSATSCDVSCLVTPQMAGGVRRRSSEIGENLPFVRASVFEEEIRYWSTLHARLDAKFQDEKGRVWSYNLCLQTKANNEPLSAARSSTF
jgi:hypothetical protein